MPKGRKSKVRQSAEGTKGLTQHPGNLEGRLLAARQARKVESELEGRLATYAKLCSAYADGAYRGRGEAGLATDQARSAIPFVLGRHSECSRAATAGTSVCLLLSAGAAPAQGCSFARGCPTPSQCHPALALPIL